MRWLVLRLAPYVLFLSDARFDAAKDGSVRDSRRFSSSFSAKSRSYSASSPYDAHAAHC